MMVDINKYKYVKQLEGEIWKGVPGYENYEVSNMGRVRSLDHYTLKSGDCRSTLIKGRILSQTVGKTGYYTVLMYPANSTKKDRKLVKVHRMIALAFLDNPHNLPQINHKDEDKTNNRLENLEYCDGRYNINYGTAIERAKSTFFKSYTEKVRRIIQYKQDGSVVQVFKNMFEATSKTGYTSNSISLCCNGYCKTCHGYVFKYEGDEFVAPVKKRSDKLRKVVCLTLSGDLVAEYDTINDAGRALGSKNGASILHVIKGRNQTAFGYNWMYSEDYYKNNKV